MLPRLLLCASLLSAVPGWAQDLATDRAIADYLQQSTSRSSAGLRESALSAGGVALDLSGRFRHVYLARIDDDRSTSMCAGSVAEASRFFGRDLRTGADLPASSEPDKSGVAELAQLHGMSEAEYRYYYALIERSKALPTRSPNAATFVLDTSGDAAGEGFNDSTPVSQVGGNTGNTRGQQRRNVFIRAGEIWGAELDSNVSIEVAAQFNPFPGQCNAAGGVLGAAGPATTIRDFSGAPFTGTFYPVALANKLNGSDLNAATEEIGAEFNSDVDGPTCLGSTSFYYGLDNASPGGNINLLIVVLHELGHGLGSLSFTDETTGAFPGTPAFPDIWARYQFDRSSNVTWLQMTNAQRAASALNTNNLLWDGPNVRIASGFLTSGRDNASGRVELYTPNPLELGSSVSHWNTRASPDLLMEPVINLGLPLTLDLTRQQMRDIGWFRDSNGDRVADTITNVQPSSGTFNAGDSQTITWTNGGGFNRRVTIELSTDGGNSYAITVASDIANTGSYNWTVPSAATSSARLRVREHDYAAPLGASSGNFTINSGNSAPTFTPVAALTRQQGSPAGTAVTLGAVTDGQTSAGSLTVTQIAGGTASGITVTSLLNTAGTVSASVGASCTAVGGTLRFQVSDGGLTSTADLPITVTPNAAPTLAYAATAVGTGSNATITPSVPLSDNGSVTTVAVLSDGSYTGGISVNANGVISLSGAAPAGTHTITIRAIDNCFANRDASFQLTVGNSAPSFVPVAALSRQQGSPAGAAVTVGTVSDGQTSPAQLTVTQIAGGSATGISVTDIVNNAGTVSAVVGADCSAVGGTVRFQVSDGGLVSTADLQVNVSANTPPVLGSYPASSVASGGSINVIPAAAPSDNGSVVTLAAGASGFSGSLSGAPTTGVISVGNAGPVGSYTVFLNAIDNCNAARSGSFVLDVGAGDGLYANGFE